MKAVVFFKLFGINNPATQSNNPEDHNPDAGIFEEASDLCRMR
jgi:hypothetical protein